MNFDLILNVKNVDESHPCQTLHFTVYDRFGTKQITSQDIISGNCN
jgi:hypothetical protein